MDRKRKREIERTDEVYAYVGMYTYTFIVYKGEASYIM